jgi:hypothetical protein
MNINEAVDYMKQSRNVQDWNQRRDVVFNNFNNSPMNEKMQLILAIDGIDTEKQQQSLIVQTLGKDSNEFNNTDNNA